jgi:hypothetical protein
MTKSKIYIIAGNNQQANDWMKSNANKRWESGDTSVSLSDYIIVSSIDSLRGIRNPSGVFIGTWRERPDIKMLLSFISAQSDMMNDTINRLSQTIV